jgi:hypothetical protein
MTYAEDCAPDQPASLGDVAGIIAQRIAHQTLRLALAWPVEEPEQIVNDGVGMHARGCHIRLQQPLRLGDWFVLGANCGFEFGGSVGHSEDDLSQSTEPSVRYAR